MRCSGVIQFRPDAQRDHVPLLRPQPAKKCQDPAQLAGVIQLASQLISEVGHSWRGRHPAQRGLVAASCPAHVAVDVDRFAKQPRPQGPAFRLDPGTQPPRFDAVARSMPAVSANQRFG
jgi:hypothetical protein